MAREGNLQLDEVDWVARPAGCRVSPQRTKAGVDHRALVIRRQLRTKSDSAEYFHVLQIPGFPSRNHISEHSFGSQRVNSVESRSVVAAHAGGLTGPRVGSFSWARYLQWSGIDTLCKSHTFRSIRYDKEHKPCGRAVISQQDHWGLCRRSTQDKKTAKKFGSNISMQAVRFSDEDLTVLRSAGLIKGRTSRNSLRRRPPVACPSSLNWVDSDDGASEPIPTTS